MRLALVTLLACLAACRTYDTLYVHPDLKGKAEREKVIDLPEGDEALDLKTSFGDIFVRVAADEPQRVVAKLTLRARTDQEAEEALKGFDVALEPKGDRLEARRTGQPYRLRDASDYAVAPVVELHATLRPGRALVADTSSGRIEVVGAAGDCDLKTGFGDIVVAGARAEKVRAVTSSGAIRLQDVEAHALDLSTSFGMVRLVEVTGDVVANASSGNILVREFADGTCSLTTSFGDIRAQGRFSGLELATGSGDIDVTVDPKSRVVAAWTLESSFGDVSVALPEDLDCDLEASTSFGAIRSDLPLAGEEKLRKGTLGAGGQTVRLVTSSGDIRIRGRTSTDEPGTRRGPLIGRRRPVTPERATFVAPIHRVFDNRSLVIAMENAGERPVVGIAVTPPQGVALVAVGSHTAAGSWDAKKGVWTYAEPVAPGAAFHLQVTVDRLATGEITDLFCRVLFAAE